MPSGRNERAVGRAADRRGDELRVGIGTAGGALHRRPDGRVGRRFAGRDPAADVDVDAVAEVGEQLRQRPPDVVVVLPRDRSHVDLHVDPIGDDVGLLPALDDRGCVRRVGAGVRGAREPRTEIAERVEQPPRIEQGRFRRVVEVLGLDPGAPRRRDPRGRAELLEATQPLGREQQCVVGTERHRSVRCGAEEPEVRDERSLLGSGDAHTRTAAAVGRDAPELGEHRIGPHRVEVVLREPVRTVASTRLLVGHADEHQRPARPEARVGEPAHGDGHGRGLVQHVDGAAAPDLTVDELASERVARPVVGTDRDDVEVPHPRQRGRLRIGALDAGHQGRAIGELGRRQALEVDARTSQRGREHVDTAALAARLGRPVIDAPVADQLLQQLDDLAGVSIDCHRRTLGER